MKVVIVMGSGSDSQVMKGAADALDQFGVEWEARILSAHRVPDALKEYVKEQEEDGAVCFIAGAGLAAHLPGVIASFTTVPVIGVPIKAAFDGLDALLSIVQMPKGVPVATVGVNNSFNAGLLAAQMIAAADGKVHEELKKRIEGFRKKRAEAILEESRNREVFND
ncbi:MAG: 5-(carboxyamino)imidazole ribonucleotide mutase [Spirochaetia bacterium]